MLGLSLSVDLTECTEIIFSKQITEIHKIINNWNKRSLTPIGKITIVKTFLLSKLNHLLLSLPNPKPSLLQIKIQINGIFYRFIWSNKPDKINRDVMRLAYLVGGLKMVDIEVFMKSLKITWIRRLFRYNNAPWIKLLQAETSICLTKASHFGPQCFSEMIRTFNPFWQDVFEGWITKLANLRIYNNINLLTIPLLYNPLISDQPLYLPDWFQKGVITVADVVS